MNLEQAPKRKRTKPYTEIGIRRVPCSRCGAPSHATWQVCAEGRHFLGVCLDCDIAVNEIVLDFMRIPGRKKIMREYRKCNAR